MHIFAYLLIPSLFVCGCSVRRIVVNEQYRQLDTAWIEPGVTTRVEVLRRFGYPSSGNSQRASSGEPLRRPLLGETSPIIERADMMMPQCHEAMQWTVSDTFQVELVAGYIVTPTFASDKQHPAENILVRFDENDVVSLVSRTRSEDGRKVEVVDWKESRR